MKTNTQIMHDAFNEVDDNFTSHEFYDVYRKNGGHDNQIHRGALRTFLYGVANPVQGSTKLWTKKNKSNNANSTYGLIVTANAECSFDEIGCILASQLTFPILLPD